MAKTITASFGVGNIQAHDDYPDDMTFGQLLADLRLRTELGHGAGVAAFLGSQHMPPERIVPDGVTVNLRPTVCNKA